MWSGVDQATSFEGTGAVGRLIQPVGAKYGHSLNRLSMAVLSLFARLYVNTPLVEITPIKHEHNRLIREAYAAGKQYKELAQEFGISKARIRQIIHRRRK